MAERVRMQTQQPSWICNTCISTLPAPSFSSVCFVSFSLPSPPVWFKGPALSLPTSLQHLFFSSPSLSCMSPSSLISWGPIILSWPHTSSLQGALEGQKILMLTDVNLHDFLASISTTVVCLLLLYRKPKEGEERQNKAVPFMLCNLEQ